MADNQQVVDVVEGQDKVHQLQQENVQLRLMVQMMQMMQVLMRAIQTLQHRDAPATQQQPAQPAEGEQQANIENPRNKAGGKSRAASRRQRRANGWYNRGGRGNGGRYNGHGSDDGGNKKIVIHMNCR